MRGEHLRHLRCLDCNYTGTDMDDVLTHEATHVGKKLHVCPTCDAGFDDLSSCKQHKEKMHSSRYLFACNECGDEFTTETEVLEHLQQVHPEDGCDTGSGSAGAPGAGRRAPMAAAPASGEPSHDPQTPTECASRSLEVTRLHQERRVLQGESTRITYPLFWRSPLSRSGNSAISPPRGA